MRNGDGGLVCVTILPKITQFKNTVTAKKKTHTGVKKPLRWRGSVVMRIEQPADSEGQSNCVLFTYFQGDINSVVDEHFSRALNKTRKPRDLSTRNKGWRAVSSTASAASAANTHGEPSPPVLWDLPGASWAGSQYPAPTSSRIHFSTSSGVLHSSPSQPPGPWPFPVRDSGSFGPPLGVYPHPVGQELPGTSSFLNLLHSERGTASTSLGAASEPEQPPSWAGHPPARFREAAGTGLSLDSVIQAPEKKKDLYWY
ncbi:mRNAion cofactor vestigial-like protein 1 [Huso huso]|uniref:mRNAion cofactor vestigial-like protein 1 n=1 Tax=Huso huso TaxID=61971 RepID=A0ABR0Z6K4_HUSHU